MHAMEYQIFLVVPKNSLKFPKSKANLKFVALNNWQDVLQPVLAT